jgi:hypothetical protein
MEEDAFENIDIQVGEASAALLRVRVCMWVPGQLMSPS